jgi:hypothetical protein
VFFCNKLDAWKIRGLVSGANTLATAVEKSIRGWEKMTAHREEFFRAREFINKYVGPQLLD